MCTCVPRSGRCRARTSPKPTPGKPRRRRRRHRVALVAPPPRVAGARARRPCSMHPTPVRCARGCRRFRPPAGGMGARLASRTRSRAPAGARDTERRRPPRHRAGPRTPDRPARCTPLRAIGGSLALALRASGSPPRVRRRESFACETAGGGSATSFRRRSTTSYLTTSGRGTTSAGRCSTAERAGASAPPAARPQSPSWWRAWMTPTLVGAVLRVSDAPAVAPPARSARSSALLP
jgi:hypothetical protein